MVQLEEAIEILTGAAVPVCEAEEVPLMESVGRILAEDCRAQADQPPFPRSPLDGYAVRGADTADSSREHPVTLRVVGKIYAGEVYSGAVHSGEAVRLMTGAPIPEGADTVIRQEDTDRGEKSVQIYEGSKPYENYCYQGEDYKKGDVLLKKGTLITGAAAAVLASLGKGMVSVRRRVRVAVVSTGDEVIAPGEELKPGKIYDSNRYYVSARLTELGNPPTISIHCGDDPGRMTDLIRELAAEMDFIITTGGVSVGEKDIMHAVVERLGAERLFWRVSLKPGAPTLAAVYQGTPILCLSGNPFGAAANFELLARPVMARLTGKEMWNMRTEEAVLSEDFPKKGRVRRFLRGCAEQGRVSLVKGNHASGALSSMLGSNCFAEIPETAAGMNAGSVVKVHYL